MPQYPKKKKLFGSGLPTAIYTLIKSFTHLLQIALRFLIFGAFFG